MLRNVFVYKIQCELSCPKWARKVSGLSRNARHTRDAQNVRAEQNGAPSLIHINLNTSYTLTSYQGLGIQLCTTDEISARSVPH